MPTKKSAGKLAHGKTTKQAAGFTAEERAAMRERVRELKADQSREAGKQELLAAIKRMPDADRVLGTRVHAIVTAAAPSLWPKTWYGMPAYATPDGKIVCFFRGAHKFKTRYATLGFSDQAHLDDGAMWPTDFALMKLSAAEEARIAALVKQAIG